MGSAFSAWYSRVTSRHRARRLARCSAGSPSGQGSLRTWSRVTTSPWYEKRRHVRFNPTPGIVSHAPVCLRPDWDPVGRRRTKVALSPRTIRASPSAEVGVRRRGLRSSPQKKDRAGAVVSNEAGSWSERPGANARSIAAPRPNNGEVDGSSGCDITDHATWLTSNLNRLHTSRQPTGELLCFGQRVHASLELRLGQF